MVALVPSEEETPELASSVSPLCKDTVRRLPFVSQKGALTREPNHLAP